MVVHAHPDDEVFSTGGTIARYSAAGNRVVVVYSTNGEAGEIHHPELDPGEAHLRLGEIRRDEALAACRLLGVSDVFFLGFRDSGMKDTEENNHPEAFMNVPFEEAVSKLIDVMRQTKPDVVVTYDEDGGYGHPDHVNTNRVTVAAFERTSHETWGPKKLYYAARSREGFRKYAGALSTLGLQIPWLSGDFDFDSYGHPDAEITAHINITAQAPIKKRALAVHRTQIKSDFFYLNIPDTVFREALATEYFKRMHPPHRDGEQEEDLFEGLSEDHVAVA
ncbi:MAG: mycothiol conjugate amidase Mca [Chloroflexota bacterium]